MRIVNPGGDTVLRHNRIMKLLAALCLGLTMVTTAWAEDTATLTITADKAEVSASGEPVAVTYTFRVTPPAGQEIGVFSIRLLPPEEMQLPGGDDGEQIWVNEALLYSNFNRSGVFRTFEYTPESRFFAAVGSSPGKRMKEAADMLQVTATIPGGVYGSFTMDAEFIAAPDGSGESFTPVVQPARVTVIGPGGTSTQPVPTPPDAAPSPGNTAPGTTPPAAASQGDNAAPFGHAPADNAAEQGTAPAESALPGGTETAPGAAASDPGGEALPGQALIAPRRSTTWPLWAALALAAAAVAVQVLNPGGWGALLGRRSKKNNENHIEGEGKQ